MIEPWMTNREKRRQPKLGKIWCCKCDMYLVYTHLSRCPNCNYKQGKKRNKR